MNQSALCRAVAQATGESVARIRRMGFTVIEPPARATGCRTPSRRPVGRRNDPPRAAGRSRCG